MVSTLILISFCIQLPYSSTQLLPILFFFIEIRNAENVEGHVSDIVESVKSNDAIVCAAARPDEPLIESKDVVDVPQIAITAIDTDESARDENLIKYDATSVHKVETNDYIDVERKMADNFVEQSTVVSNEIVETIEMNIENCGFLESTIAASTSLIEIACNKMAASQESINGDSTVNSDESFAVKITANTTDEGISMENSIGHDEAKNVNSELSVNTIDESIVPSATTPITNEMATNAANNTNMASAAKKSKRGNRRNGSKAKKTIDTDTAVLVEMATDSDIYEVAVTPRQRQYQLMVKNAHRKVPADNCEVFCSNIPINVLEQELVPLFDRYGKIWSLRLLMSRQNSQRNAGFAFVRYMSPVSAQEAVKHLSNYEILPGKMLMVRQSQPNLSLFVGNINRNQTKEQISTIFSRLTKGLIKAVVKSSYYEANKNCGFCFLEYESHATAQSARLVLKHSKVWGRQLFVDWSQRRTEIEATGSQENTTLFINNLPKTVTDDVIRSKLAPFGDIDSVTIVKDYAFVEFQSHDSIVAVLNGFNAKEAFGSNDTELSFALKRPRRNRNSFARHSKMFLSHSYGSRSLMPFHRGFKKRQGSTVRLSVPAELPGISVNVEQKQTQVTELSQEELAGTSAAVMELVQANAQDVQKQDTTLATEQISSET